MTESEIIYQGLLKFNRMWDRVSNKRTKSSELIAVYNYGLLLVRMDSDSDLFYEVKNSLTTIETHLNLPRKVIKCK